MRGKDHIGSRAVSCRSHRDGIRDPASDLPVSRLKSSPDNVANLFAQPFGSSLRPDSKPLRSANYKAVKPARLLKAPRRKPAAAAAQAGRSARNRTDVLWGVLLLGVFVLGGMAWRLVRQMNNSASKTGDQS